MEASELLFEILRSEVNGEPIKTELCSEYDPKALYRIAKTHDLMYCVTDALNKVGALPKEKPAYDAYVNEKTTAIVRTARIEGVIRIVSETLNENEIPFVPLKGARIRSIYPDKMMRTSCDIDILVREEHLERAITALVDKKFTTDGKRGYHDVSLYFDGIHLELHFNICEDMEDIDALLGQVWEYTEPVSQYEYYEKPEFFAFHHLAHMKYHFMHGGCGIRPFLDLYMMRKTAFYKEEKLIPLLDKVGLTQFYYSVLEVNAVWFENKQQTELTKKCGDYIIRGGVYGSFENKTAVHTSLRNGRIRNALQSAFPPYPVISRLYPKLNGQKILLPLYYFIRLFEKTFKQGKTSGRKLKRILFQDQVRIDSVSELLKEMGLIKGESV